MNTEYIKRFKGCRIVATIKSISKSGMRRKILFYALKDNVLHNITSEIAEICNYKLDKDYLMIVDGCGMDMVFSVLSNLNYAMASLDNYVPKGAELIYDTYFIDADRYQLI